MRLRSLAALLALLGALAGCGSAPDPIDPAGVDGLVIPTPDPAPQDFTSTVSNHRFPLAPGTVWEYRLRLGDRRLTLEVTAGPEREVAGVDTTEVRSLLRDRRGRLVGTAIRWFAQDRDGNVWLFGERVNRHGRVARMRGDERSWRAGVAGAEAGLMMPADPRVGDAYYLGRAPGEFDGVGQVVDQHTSIATRYDDFDDALLVELSGGPDGGSRSGSDADAAAQWFFADGVGAVHAEYLGRVGSDADGGGSEGGWVLDLVSVTRPENPA